MDLSVFHHVATKTDAQTLKNIEKMYQRKTAQNKTFIIRKLVNFKYKEGRSVVEHLSDFRDLVNQLVTMKPRRRIASTVVFEFFAGKLGNFSGVIKQLCSRRTTYLNSGEI